MIGLTGAAGTGKTTLATEFAMHLGVPVLQTSTARLWQKLGLDARVAMGIEQRYAVQEIIFNEIDRQYHEASKVNSVFVADRTPLDLAAYLLMDIQRDTLAHTPELAELINKYVEKCFKAATRWFSVIVLVQPGIAVEPDRGSGKAPPCPVYMEHMNTLLNGMMIDGRLGSRGQSIPRRVTDLQTRVAVLNQAVSNSLESHHKMMKLVTPVQH